MEFDENLKNEKIKEYKAIIFLIKFHPEGKPEASICGVAKGSQ